MKQNKFRSAYDGLRTDSSDLCFRDEEGSLLNVCHVEQQHKDRCDVVKIMKQYDSTGLITHVNTSLAEYGDYTEVNEYADSLNLVIKAQDSFAALPSAIRDEFGNDPGTFFEFATNPENRDRLVELGLANPETDNVLEVRLTGENPWKASEEPAKPE